MPTGRTTGTMPLPAEHDEVVAAASAGDESAFAVLAERYRRELHVHCYRMLGSFEEAEDVVQETFLRAWRGHGSFQGGPWFRAWLYRIATNACLDAIRRSRRRVASLRSFAEVPWLQPYPDRLLDEVAPRDDEPDAVVVAKETIERGDHHLRRQPVPGVRPAADGLITTRPWSSPTRSRRHPGTPRRRHSGCRPR